MRDLQVTRPYDCKPYGGGRVKGLFIGINYTGTSAELRGCVNDVRTMLSTLERIGFPLAEAVILVDDDNFPGCSAQPTRQNIERGMRWLSEGAQAGDTLFLHYSGHGSQRPNRDGTEEDGYDETMVPLDYETAGQIVDDDVFNMVVRPLPVGVRLTAVMDCCHSGTLMDLPYEFVATRENLEQAAGDATEVFKASNRNRSGADVMLFSGCADDQTSADVSGSSFKTPGNHPGAAGGACTGALSEVFTTTHGLTFVELLLGIRDSLKKRGFKQLPQLSATKPIDLKRAFSLFGPLVAAQGHAVTPPPQMPPAPAPGAPAPPAGAPTGFPPLPQQGAYPPPPQHGGYPPQHGHQYPPPPQQHQYPPPHQGQQYPPPQGSYPPPPQQGGYPPPQGAYPPPPQQQQYPPPQGAYPPPHQGQQYPPPQQGPYPPPPQQHGGYPPQGQQYPPPQHGQQYPSPQGQQYPPPQRGSYAPPPQQQQGAYPPPQHGHHHHHHHHGGPPPQQQSGNQYYSGQQPGQGPTWQQGKYANPFSNFGR